MQRQVFVKNEEIIPHERFNQNLLLGCGKIMAVIKKQKDVQGKNGGNLFQVDTVESFVWYIGRWQTL